MSVILSEAKYPTLAWSLAPLSMTGANPNKYN